MGTAILLTGPPGSGKTTIIRRVIESLDRPAGGFYTEEIRERGTRRGFAIVTLDGARATLAHVSLTAAPHVGKYGVDLAALDRVAAGAIDRALAAGRLLVIDEIGPMEILSESFRAATLRALDGPTLVLGTIVRRSTPFTDGIKARPDVMLVQVTSENRSGLPAHILHLIHQS